VPCGDVCDRIEHRCLGCDPQSDVEGPDDPDEDPDEDDPDEDDPEEGVDDFVDEDDPDESPDDPLPESLVPDEPDEPSDEPSDVEPPDDESDVVSDDESDDVSDEPLDDDPFPPLFDSRLSVLKKPLPLNVTPTGWNTFLTGMTRPDDGWAASVRVSSVNDCWTSIVSPESTNL
jgi:hypothetical protein